METNIFARRLKETRQNLNKSMSDLAEETGLTASAISSYEKEDGKTPSLINAQKIATALGVSLDWLSGMDEVQSDDNLCKEEIAANVLKAIDVLKKHTPFFVLPTTVVDQQSYNLVMAINNISLSEYLSESAMMDKAIQVSNMSPQLQSMVKSEIKKKFIKILANKMIDGVIADDNGYPF